MLQGRVEQLIHQGALAAATHPRDADQATKGDLDIDAAEIVAAAIDQGQAAAAGIAALGRRRNRTATTEIGAGERMFRRQQILK